MFNKLLEFARFRIWIPSVMAFKGEENFSLQKTKNHQNLRVKSDSKKYVKSISNKNSMNRKNYFSRKK